MLTVQSQSKSIPHYENTHHGQVRFTPEVQGWFNSRKCIIMYHVNKSKEIKPIHFLIDAEKAFDKIQHSFMIQTLKRH